MKRNTFLSILLTCLTLIMITSCSKKNDDTPIVADTLELLTDKNWVEQNLSFSEAGHDETAAYSLIYGDISVFFNANGTYFVNSQNYGILTEGTWVISEDQTMLTATDTNTSNVFNITIVSISSSSLGLQFMYTYNNGLINVNVFIEGTFVPA